MMVFIERTAEYLLTARRSLCIEDTSSAGHWGITVSLPEQDTGPLSIYAFIPETIFLVYAGGLDPRNDLGGSP